MRSDRLLIAAVLFLGGGLWMLLAYCHGTTGLGLALPIASTKFTVDITTMGVPVLIGVPLLVIGLVLLIVAFVRAILEQFGFHRTHAEKPRADAGHLSPQ